MKKLSFKNKILFSILFIICLFLFKNINEVKAATIPYRWPIGGDNANETYIDYEYYGQAGQEPVKDGKSGREYKVNNKLWPNEQPYYNQCESHFGMDITGINGHTYKVVSVVEGTVIATNAEYGYNPNKTFPDRNQRNRNATFLQQEGGGYGNYIVIQESSTGKCFLYAHLKGGSFKVSTGSKVKVGQEIATMGSSGDSGHMHLHFEVRTSKEATLNMGWGLGRHTFQIATSKTNLDPKDYIGSTPKRIKEIKATAPTKTKYIQGSENIDVTGAKLTVRYASEINTTINLPNKDVKVSGFDNSKIGKNTVTVEYQGLKTTFDVEIVAKPYTPAKRTKITFQRFYKYRKINIYFSKPIVLSSSEPVVTVDVQNETKQAKFMGVSDDGKKLMYIINYDEFDIFTEGTMYVTCSGRVLDKENLQMSVNCNLNRLTIGKMYKCELKHTFSSIINNGKGDVNGDGMIDARDASKVLCIYTKMASNEELSENEKKYLDRADVNGNGKIDAIDATIILSYYADKSAGVSIEDEQKILKCDVNSDNTVDIKDFDLLKSKITNSVYDEKYDLNDDGILNNDDIEFFRKVMYDLGSRRRK